MSATRFFFPDSPTTAYFLTAEERVAAVKRIKSNQAGVENKQWKREQCVLFFAHKAYLMKLFYEDLSKHSATQRFGSWHSSLLSRKWVNSQKDLVQTDRKIYTQ